jgi:two-component system chemotaxis sensor kinase CheA
MRTDDLPRVLVVDDERANLTLMAEALKPEFRTIAAKSGTQALERAMSTTPPDLILLDIMMPEMDGYEVCRILKADERTRNIPVIFVSAMSEVGDETRGLDIGAVDYITKPFNSAIVRARVRTHLESAMARAKISSLLDNSGQGFLSFGLDLRVDGEYSGECRNIFGAPIAGLPIGDLLYPGDDAGRRNLTGNLQRILAEKDGFKTDLYISLMPAEFHLNGKFLRAEYRPIGKGKLMLVLTDITATRELEREIHLERTRLGFIVSAVRETRDFFEVLKTFEDFDNRGFEELLASDAPSLKILDEVYRVVHTFKALFQQLDFPRIPAALHAVESRLSEMRRAGESPEREALRVLYPREELRGALDCDLKVLEDALGPEFLRGRDRIFITGEQAARLEALAGRLTEEKSGLLDGPALELLRELKRSRRIGLKSLLGGYPKAALRIAERLGKTLRPFGVEGDDIPVDPDRLRGFTKSLVHVFRNAVVHGIETPDERVLLGKDEAGVIACSIARRGDEIILQISDDGRGLDAEAIRARAVSAGLRDSMEIRVLEDGAVFPLIFEEELSTAGSVTDFSGRGIGLSAVKSALCALGGRIEIETEAERGTTLRFIVKSDP